MLTQRLNTDEAPTKWWAARDARMKNLKNKSHYPLAIQVQIERMMLVLPMVYSSKGIYEAYGKTGVSVKIDGARVTDKKNLTELENEWTIRGFVKRVTPQGIIYRLGV